MKPANKYSLVLVTAPDLKTARLLARTALEARCAACVSLIPAIESHYRWGGGIECNREVLLLLKTLRSRLAALEKLIVASHPYDTPEFIVLSVRGGNRKYLHWLERSCLRGKSG